MNQNGIFTVLTPLIAFGVVIGLALGVGNMYLVIHDGLSTNKELAKLVPTIVSLFLLLGVGGVATLVALRVK